MSGDSARANRRVFGLFEVAFDAAYLLSAGFIGASLLIGGGALRKIAAAMALVLVFGDAFHLIPRMAAALVRDVPRMRRALGVGKLVSSVTMTVFYLLLWEFGRMALSPGGMPGLTALVYGLGIARIALCLFPQNRWLDDDMPVNWAVLRNAPFFAMGLAVAGLYLAHAGRVEALRWMWLAVLLSFAFYLPVVLFSGRNRKIGMLMLPKTAMYIWMLVMLSGAAGA